MGFGFGLSYANCFGLNFRASADFDVAYARLVVDVVSSCAMASIVSAYANACNFIHIAIAKLVKDFVKCSVQSPSS